jgi:hypothetical protein
LADLQRDHSNQKEKSEIRKMLNGSSEMWDGKCNVLQHTGINGEAKKHSLKRSLENVKKPRVKNGYIC